VLAHADGGVEITQGLKLVLNVAPAFVEQIVVDRALFVNRHKFPQHVLFQLEPLGGDLYYRAAVGFENIVHGIVLWMIDAAGHFDLGEQTILLLIAAANSL
jgi:hypothetical protein